MCGGGNRQRCRGRTCEEEGEEHLCVCVCVCVCGSKREEGG